MGHRSGGRAGKSHAAARVFQGAAAGREPHDGNVSGRGRSANISWSGSSLGGADKICFVISPGKSDILEYYGGGGFGASIVLHACNLRPPGSATRSSARSRSSTPDEPVLVGLPDTIWFPEGALRALPDDQLSFLLFPVRRPELFDAVVLDHDRVLEIQVKSATRVRIGSGAPSRCRADRCGTARAVAARGQRDEYVGTLVNAWIAEGGAGAWRACRRKLRRRRHGARLSRGDRAAQRRRHGAGGRKRSRQYGRDASLTGEADRMGARAHQAVSTASAAACDPGVHGGGASRPAAMADEGGHRCRARIAGPSRLAGRAAGGSCHQP